MGLESVLPVIGQGLGIVGSIVNANNQREMNDQNWIRQAQMYNTQRADALADWNMQNAYNSPAAQMERLKRAGLNPNLVYGQGAVANNTQQPRGSSPGGPQGIAPHIDLSGIGQSFIQMYQMGIMQAQQNAIRQMTALNAAKTQTEYGKSRIAGAQALMSEAKIPFAASMADSAAGILEAQKYRQTAEGNLAALQYEIQNKLFNDGVPIQKALNDLVIQGKIIAKSEADTNLTNQKLKSEAFRTDVEEFRSNMAKKGLNPNDPAWMKVLISLLDKWGLKIPGYN